MNNIQPYPRFSEHLCGTIHKTKLRPDTLASAIKYFPASCHLLTKPLLPHYTILSPYCTDPSHSSCPQGHPSPCPYVPTCLSTSLRGPLSPHSLSRNTAAISPSLRDHWSVKRASSFQFAHCFLCCTEAFQFDGSYHFALFLWLVLLMSSSKPSLWRRPMPKNFSPMLSFSSLVVFVNL